MFSRLSFESYHVPRALSSSSHTHAGSYRAYASQKDGAAEERAQPLALIFQTAAAADTRDGSSSSDTSKRKIGRSPSLSLVEGGNSSCDGILAGVPVTQWPLRRIVHQIDYAVDREIKRRISDVEGKVRIACYQAERTALSRICSDDDMRAACGKHGDEPSTAAWKYDH